MDVLLACGHVGPPWPCVKALGGMVRDAWCEPCQEWRGIERKATLSERAGFTLPTLPEDDDPDAPPPF